jgi:hypothetical protein
VNAGILEVCRIFLGDNMTKYNKQHVDVLVGAMNEFIKTLEKALEVNKRLIKSDQLVLQNELERGFEFLKSEVAKYMTVDLGDADDDLDDAAASDMED